MGLSILMQNVALMAMSADLLDVPPMLGGRSFSFGPFYAKPELLIGLPSRSPAPWRCASCCRRPIWARRSAPPCRTAKPPSSWAFRFPAFITFAAGSALVGLSACVMMPLFSVPDRRPQLRADRVRDRRALGGMGSIEGALLGGICIGIVQSLSSYYIAPAYGQMFFFILFLLVMIFRPAGLLGRKGEASIGIND